jgi:uncharacterized membrane protein
MTASPENLAAILVMALAAMAAKAGGFLAMRWLGQHRFVAAWLEHAPGAVLVSAAVAPIQKAPPAGVVAARWASGFTPGLFAAVGAVALARWAGLG